MSQAPKTPVPAANTMEAAFRRTFSAEVDNATQSAFHNLVESAERARLPEPIFREHFLPFFTGKVEADPQNNIYANWIGVAGAPTAEVDVINEEGNPLFTVPALLNTSGLEVLRSRHSGRSIMDMVADYNDESVGLPSVAQNKFYKGLAEKGRQIITNNPAQTRDQLNWKKIADYYQLGGTPAAGSPQVQQTKQDDPLEYD